MVKVPASSVSSPAVVAKPGSVVVPPSRLGVVRGARKVSTLADLAILQVISDDEEVEEEEKEASEGSRDHRGSGSSSSSGSRSSDDGGGDDDNDEDVEDSRTPRNVDSMELGLEGGLAKEDREVVSRAEDAGVMPCRRHVHIMCDGRDIPTDENEDEGFVGKRPLGDADRGSLQHFAIACGFDEPDIELFTSLDLRGCRLIGTDEEHQFMASMYRRIYMPEVELMLSNESIDHLIEDLEVIGMRAIMLARAARRHHGHVETELLERVKKLEKSKEGLSTANKELKAKIESLEALIAKNKGLVDEAQELLNRNIDLHSELNDKGEKLEEAENFCKKAEVARKKAEELAETNA